MPTPPALTVPFDHDEPPHLTFQFVHPEYNLQVNNARNTHRDVLMLHEITCDIIMHTQYCHKNNK